MTEEIPGGGDGAPAGDVFEELVLDEDFVRAAEAPEPRPWRSDEPPAGWFFSKARRRGRRRRR
ncbi:hypothetical protein ABT298_06795 [Streptomyces sp. NPDC001034]|uniref:hypothetical protein n=1 Tax=Streptomyces sp. NPDC001034 TaxID=3154375 RepID=UPI00332D04B0